MLAETVLMRIRNNGKFQPLLGLFFGVIFGFLLQKSGIVRYDAVVGQLLLYDFTFMKVMLSAVLVGSIGFYLLKRAGLVRPHIRQGSAGANVIGGLIFGTGFALLGYCPGTVAGAAGSGALDALLGGFSGLLIGSALFAALYPAVTARFPDLMPFRNATVPHLLGAGERVVIAGVVLLSIALFLMLECLGL